MTWVKVSRELYQQIVQVIRNYLKTSNVVELSAQKAIRRTLSGFRRHRVILDEDVDGTDDPLTPSGNVDPTQHNATICQWSKTQEKWIQTEQRLGVANLSEEDWSEDDAGWAEPEAGIYLLAGCPQAVTDRETPPWENA